MNGDHLVDGFPDALRPDQCLCLRRAMGVEQIRHDAYVRLRGDQGSIAGWIRPSNNPMDGADHFYFGLIRVVPNPASQIGLFKSAFNFLGLLIFDGFMVTGGAIGAPAGLTAGDWHLLAATWNPAACAMYLDGALLAPGPVAAAGNRSLPAGAEIGIGLLPADASAEIGNAMWFSRELRVEEIAQMWTDGVGL